MLAPAPAPALAKPSPNHFDRQTLLEAVEREAQGSSISQEAGDDLSALNRPEEWLQMVASSFAADSQQQHHTALELARAGNYIASKNYLNLSLMHDQPTAETMELCKNSVNNTRSTAKSMKGGGYTWGDFPDKWRNCLQIAHRLLIAKPRPADELLIWIKMLINSPELFGGPSSHLTLAFVDLICSKLLDPERFGPQAKILAFVDKDKVGTWAHGIILSQEEGTKRAAKGATNKSTTKPRSQHAEAESTTPGFHDRLFSATTSARATTVAQVQPLGARASTAASEPMIKIRLNATQDLPQRTAALQEKCVFRDVGLRSAKPYLPGLLLLEAASAGKEGLVAALLKAGVSIYESDNDANSALLSAAFHSRSDGHHAVCKLLLEWKGDPDTPNRHALSARDCAFARRDTALRRIFCPSESDKDFTPAAVNSTELHRAIESRNDSVALPLVTAPMPPIVNEVTALMLAARKGTLPVVQACLNSGCNVEQRSASACTAIYLAAEEGHAHLLRAMLVSSVPPYRLLVPDLTGSTPLMRASENGHLQVVETLINAYKEHVNLANTDGWTALMLAAYNGFADVAHVLLDAGARPGVGRQHFPSRNVIYTPLCYAAWVGHLECVKVLICHQASHKDQKMESAMQLADRNGNVKVSELLRMATNGSPIAPSQIVSGAHPSQRGKEVEQSDSTLATALAMAREGESAVEAVAPGPENISLEERAKDPRANLDASQVDALAKDVEELSRQLSEVRTERKALREAHTVARAISAKQPWAFSPSGKWLPGLWSGLWDRDHPISNAIGAPPQSVSFIGMAPRKKSPGGKAANLSPTLQSSGVAKSKQ